MADPFFLSAQLQALLFHTATLEQRLSQRDIEFANLQAHTAALTQTILIMRQKQEQNDNTINKNDKAAGGGGGGGGGDGPSKTQQPKNQNITSPPRPAPPTDRETQIIKSMQHLDKRITSCMTTINTHSSKIFEMASQFETTRGDLNNVNSVLPAIKNGIRNLDHHTMTNAAGVARCQAEVARMNNSLHEFQSDIRKKVREMAGKVAQEGAVRPAWDLSPTAPVATFNTSTLF